MTTAKINTAPETCCFTPWTFALIHCLRIFQGDPSLLIFPSGCRQAGPESHVHCCHCGLGLWPGTKRLCLAGASPCPTCSPWCHEHCCLQQSIVSRRSNSDQQSHFQLHPTFYNQLDLITEYFVNCELFHDCENKQLGFKPFFASPKTDDIFLRRDVKRSEKPLRWQRVKPSR